MKTHGLIIAVHFAGSLAFLGMRSVQSESPASQVPLKSVHPLKAVPPESHSEAASARVEKLPAEGRLTGQLTNWVERPIDAVLIHTNQHRKSNFGKEPALDPLARLSLRSVGADAESEAYWMLAINDPELPANERKDLIEDLNQDGLSDPKHPSAQDRLLILNRIQLIEDLAPSAMDQVNASAFAEAYKDLLNLASLPQSPK